MAMGLTTTAKGIGRTLHRAKSVLQLASPTHRREKAVASDLIQRIEQAGFSSKVHQVHYVENAQGGAYKYLNLPWHVAQVVHEANRLGLLDAPPMRVLDIGCGTGAFLYALRHHGHDVLGMDLDSEPIFNDMTSLLGIPRCVHRIECFQRLPDLGEPFDLITAYSICFDCHGSDDYWREDEWSFFIDDCLSRLEPGGRLYFNFNPAKRNDFAFLPESVAQFMRSLPGATLSRSNEVLTVAPDG